MVYKYDSVGIINSSISSDSASSSDTSTSPNSPMTHYGSRKGHSISFPLQEKNIVSSAQKEKKENNIRNETSSIRNHCIVLLGNQLKNKDFEEQKTLKINEKEENECISNDANERTAEYIGKFLRDYYKDNNTEPKTDEVKDIVCSGYRKIYGTGQEDGGDRKRIISMLDKMIKSFKPEKIGSVRYEQFMFVPYIKETFDKTKYKDILKDTSASKYRPNNILLDLYAGYCYTHLSRNRELTLSTYDGFKKYCAKYGVILKYNNKCLACRLLFEHYGWLKKINPDYVAPRFEISGSWKVVKKKGKAMAYRLTDKFPFYSEFKKSAGGKNAEKVETKGKASMQDWDSMDNTA